MHKRCAFKCEPRDIPMHRFPNVNKYPETFKAWVSLVGGKLDSIEDYKYYKEKRVCDIHFTDRDRIGANRLCIETVPSLHIPGKLAGTSEVTAGEAAEPGGDNEISQAPAPQGNESRRIVNEDVTVAKTSDSASETGDALCKKPTACRSETKCSKTITRPPPKKVLVLRLVSDRPRAELGELAELAELGELGELDEPVYEVLHGAETRASAAETHVALVDKHVQANERSRLLSKTTRNYTDTTYTLRPQPVHMDNEQFRLADKEDTTFVEIESPSFANDVAPLGHELPSSGTGNPSIEKDVLSKGLPTKERIEDKLSRGLEEKDKNMCYWQMKLMHIVHNSQFCGICLDARCEMNALGDPIEIVDNEQIHATTLQDMAKEVFSENANIANSQICNNCTNKLIQSFIFIRNAKNVSTSISSHLSDLYNKTSYILNEVNKNSNNPQSQIHNVVIAFDHNDQLENYDNSTIKTEKLSTEHSERDLRKETRKMKCVSCNIILPSYRAWRLHESTTHKRALRCSICLQSYRTRANSTTHYRTRSQTRHSSKNHHRDKPFTHLYLYRHQKGCEQIQRKCQCGHCAPNFDTWEELMRHSRFTRGEHKLSCGVCRTGVGNGLKKRRHELAEHCRGRRDSLPQLTPRKHTHTESLALCEICGKITRQFLLKKHLQSHGER